ncbi:MAG TPA: hypothetical protein VK858_18790 [Longimicrobiales bacterium]|nr:hypothetical protein [Longimicrobiales bacterium]
MRPRLLLLAALLLLSPLALRAQAPIQLSLFPPIQLVDESEGIQGVRLGVYAKNAGMEGFDLGIVTHTTGDVLALQVALANIVEGDASGAQVGWGLGFAIANVVRGDFTGFQSGLYNGAGSARALQLGALNNVGGRVAGLQLGLVNVAEDMNGFQVGLVNIIRSKDRFPVLPIVNWKLDG